MRRTICIACCAALSLALLSCSDDETPVAPPQTAGATVSGTLELPDVIDNGEYFVWIDTDIDPENGFVKMVSGQTGTEPLISYSLGKIPAGTYFLYASACCGIAREKLPLPVDLMWGVYGSPVQITSITPESGPVGTRVTLQGGMVANAVVPKAKGEKGEFDIKLGYFDPDVLADDMIYISVDGYSCNEFTMSVTESIDFLMPNAGAAGDHFVRIRHRGMVSYGVTWTQEGDGDPSEPNDAPGAGRTISIPDDFAGSFLSGDTEDWYRINVNSTTTVSVVMDWNSHKNIDMVIMDVYTLVCSALTYDKPESILSCTLTPGTYYFGVGDISGMNGDPSLVSYRVTITSP